MTRPVIHIGAPKCGSSALQSGLTREPVFTGAGGKTFIYVVLDHEGRVRSGHELEPNPVYGYRATVDMAHLLQHDEAAFAAMRRDLSQIAHPVLSNEGMFASSPAAAEVLARLGFEVDIVAYLRPQVDFMNSAWWQWGAWSGREVPDQIKRLIRLCDYDLHLGRWAEIPEVRTITLRILDGDILSDFRALLGAPPPPPHDGPRVNASLPEAVLRLAQRNPDLHRRLGPQLDFVLARRMSFDGLAPTPWVLDRALVERIINRHRAGNEAILARLDPENAARMRADPRWWDPASYAGRTALPLPSTDTTPAEMDRLAIRLIEALLEAQPAPFSPQDQRPEP
jgi:hypothetical protein